MKPVRLDLSTHCIQTEIKKLYNQAVSAYFRRDSEKQDLENRIELLKNALESLDFQRLRSTYAELAGGREESVYLESGPDGQIHIKVNQKEIPVPLKSKS